MKIDEYQKMYRLEKNYWWYVGKRKLILGLLDRLYSSSANIKIMDVGCGTGIMMNYLKKYGSVVGIDTSDEALNFCRLRGKGRVYKASINQLPFDNSSFGLVTALDVIEHVEEDEQALRELFRVCKKGGRVTITAPAYNFLWSKHDIALGHKRRYTARKLKKKIESVGFKIEFLSYSNIFAFPLVLIWRILENLLRPKALPESDSIPILPIVNRLLILLYHLESILLRHFSLPYGVSLVCVAKK